jgi:cell fate regulator YaaT (PSP1 superfamily)
MAKEQNLTLNSMKISGPCGRLLCCLAYEYDTYRECRKELPSEGTRIRTDRGTLKIVDINIFNRQAKLEEENGGTFLLSFDRFVHDSKRDQWRIQED